MLQFSNHVDTVDKVCMLGQICLVQDGTQGHLDGQSVCVCVVVGWGVHGAKRDRLTVPRLGYYKTESSPSACQWSLSKTGLYH